MHKLKKGLTKIISSALILSFISTYTSPLSYALDSEEFVFENIGTTVDSNLNGSDNTENNEGSENPDSSENTENNEDLESPDSSENTENNEDLESPDSSENTENNEDLESPDSSENTENNEGLENPDSSENTENNEDLESPDSSGNTGGSGNLVSSYPIDTNIEDENGAITDISNFFSSPVGYTNSVVEGNTVKLSGVTPSSYKYSQGAITTKQKIDFKNSFEFEGRIRLSANSDGMAVTFHNDPRGVNAMGGPGGGLGAGASVENPEAVWLQEKVVPGITNGFLLEFDMYKNNKWLAHQYEGKTDADIDVSSSQFHTALIKLQNFDNPSQSTYHDMVKILDKDAYLNFSNDDDKRVPFLISWKPDFGSGLGTLTFELGGTDTNGVNYPKVTKTKKISLSEVCHMFSSNGQGTPSYNPDNMYGYMTLSTSTSGDFRNPKQEFDFVKFRYTEYAPNIETSVYDINGNLIKGIDSNGVEVNKPVKPGQELKIEIKTNNKNLETFKNNNLEFESSKNLDLNSINNVVVKEKATSSAEDPDGDGYVEKSYTKDDLINSNLHFTLTPEVGSITYDATVSSNVDNGDVLTINHNIVPDLKTALYPVDIDLNIEVKHYPLVFLSSSGTNGFKIGYDLDSKTLVADTVSEIDLDKSILTETKLVIYNKLGIKTKEIAIDPNFTPRQVVDFIDSENIIVDEGDSIQVFNTGTTNDQTTKMKLEGFVEGASESMINTGLNISDVDNGLFEICSSHNSVHLRYFVPSVDIGVPEKLEIMRAGESEDTLVAKIIDNISSIIINPTNSQIVGSNKWSERLSIDVSNVKFDEVGGPYKSTISITVFDKVYTQDIDIYVIKSNGIDVSVPLNLKFAVIGNLVGEDKFIAPEYNVINYGDNPINIYIKEFIGDNNSIPVVAKSLIKPGDSVDKHLSLRLTLEDYIPIELYTKGFTAVLLGSIDANDTKSLRLTSPAYGKDFSKFKDDKDNKYTSYKMIWRIKDSTI